MKLPKKARMLALRHKLNFGRDTHGNYFIKRAGKVVDTTRSAKPTASNALALVRRNVRGKNPAKRPRRTVRRKNPAGWVVKARKGTGGTHVFLFDGAKLGNGPPAIYPTLNGATAAAIALFAKYPKLYGRDWKVWVDVYGSNARP